MPTTIKSSTEAPKRRTKEIWHASMAQFCAVTGKAIADVKRASRDPEAAKLYFRVSRVSERLVAWIDANPAVEEPTPFLEKERLQAEKLSKENRKLDLEHELRTGKYITREEAKAGWSKGMEVVQKVMLTFLEKTVYNKAIRELRRELEALNI